MKKIWKYLVGISVVTFLVAQLQGCDKDRSFSEAIIKFPDFYGSISLPAAADLVTADLIMGASDTSFSINALAVGDHAAGHTTDIKVTINTMPQLVDSFNAKNGTSYPLLPQECFTLTDNDAVIKSGELESGRVILSLDARKITNEGTFVLPVGITAMSDPDFILNRQRMVIFFIVAVKKA